MADTAVPFEMVLDLGNGFVLQASEHLATEPAPVLAGNPGRQHLRHRKALRFLVMSKTPGQYFEVDAAQAQVLLDMRAAVGVSAVATNPTAKALADLLGEQSTPPR